MCILGVARIITLEKCRKFASLLIKFSINSDEEIDETCLRQIFWELDNELGARSSQHIIKNYYDDNHDDNNNNNNNNNNNTTTTTSTTTTTY